MLDELVGQAKRLFSSKKNGAKLVATATDRLHFYKQVLLATCIVLLLGYSQFREHFTCRANGHLDKRFVTNLCWINGTMTVATDERQPVQQVQWQQQRRRAGATRESAPHVGIRFKRPQDRQISHNHMRSVWSVLILMAACSFAAQRSWSQLFSGDTLRAVLRLPGSEELAVAKAAQLAAVCAPQPTTTTSLASPASPRTLAAEPRPEFIALSLGAQDMHKRQQAWLEAAWLAAGAQNAHLHSLNEYANQLGYLLLCEPTANSGLSVGLGSDRGPPSPIEALDLRRTMLQHAFLSLALTGMQLALPLVALGPEYMWYGWRYAQAVLEHLWGWPAGGGAGSDGSKLAAGSMLATSNSFDYHISHNLWPTVVMCEVRQFGVQGQEVMTVFCSVAINEICAKLFAVIWWIVAVNLTLELVNFLGLLACSCSERLAEQLLGRYAWPRVRHQANLLASFGHRRARLLELAGNESERKQTRNSLNHTGHRMVSAAERKRLEAAGCEPDRQHYGSQGRHWRRLHHSKASTPSKAAGAPLGCNPDVYQLLYLLYLRLKKSRAQLEQLVLLTASALERYLDALESRPGEAVACSELAKQPLPAQQHRPSRPKEPQQEQQHHQQQHQQHHEQHHHQQQQQQQHADDTVDGDDSLATAPSPAASDTGSPESSCHHG